MTPPPQDTLVSRKLMTGFARDFTGRECTEMSFAEVEEIAKFLLEEIVLRQGAPRVIITDRGAVFRSRLVSSLVDLCNIDHRFTTAYHPQTNGLTERFNKTLADILSMYVDVEQKNWDEILPFVTFAYNTAKQETTGLTPFYLLHGHEAETTLDTMLPFYYNATHNLLQVPTAQLAERWTPFPLVSGSNPGPGRFIQRLEFSFHI
ncbi:transposon Ty3-I Gag-Pol polyprotein [Trichonephila clavipes]|nr:transposon Ty3-I Gag-Pol polyprotein [Trichonephila clavipes]